MLDAIALREQFPALHRKQDGQVPVFLDGPGGTQVPQRVIDAMLHYLTTCNANQGGVFATSQESDRILDAAHEAVADLLNTPAPDEIVFGQNMTSLTLHLSRSLARTWRPGDEVIVTRLDHDANITPWLLAARDAGASVRWVDVHPEDCTLDLHDLRQQLSPRTRLVAVSGASNAVGTISPVHSIVQLAHEAGAVVFVDAVHLAPHGPIDVQDWDCDFLTCSAYKFFGPHVGVLWGKRGLLEELPVYKVRPASDLVPGRWMTGTQNHEGLAGVAAAVDYLADIGAKFGSPEDLSAPAGGRRRQLRAAMLAIRTYELELSERLLRALAGRPRFKVWGVAGPSGLDWRVPTVSMTSADHITGQIAEHLARRHIYVWHGNLYALELAERLGVEERGGFLRLGLVHYNTFEEIDRLMGALDEL